MQHTTKTASYANKDHHDRKDAHRGSGRFLKARCAKAERAYSRTTLKDFMLKDYQKKA